MQTPIRRDLQRQLMFNFAGLALAGVAVWGFLTIEFGLARWAVTIVAGLAGLIVFFYGLGTAGIGECPHCESRLAGIDPKTNTAVLCPACQQFATGTGGTLDITPADYVATVPAFGAALPDEHITWPIECCVCAGEASRVIEKKLVHEQEGSAGRDLAVGVASLGLLGAVDRTTYRIAVPHCDVHQDGASLVEPKGLEPVAIAFRSHAYHQKFVTLNQVTPRELMTQ